MKELQEQYENFMKDYEAKEGDLIIELDDGKKYSGRVELDLNCDNLIENGKSQIEITDFSNIIFKRI